MTSSSIFLNVVLFHLSSLVTGPSFMSISLLGLELWQFLFVRHWQEIWKSEIPVWTLPNIWRLGKVRNTKFGTKISSKMLINAAKFQGYRFYRFWSELLKENQLWEGGRGDSINPKLRLMQKASIFNNVWITFVKRNDNKIHFGNMSKD